MAIQVIDYHDSYHVPWLLRLPKTKVPHFIIFCFRIFHELSNSFWESPSHTVDVCFIKSCPKRIVKTLWTMGCLPWINWWFGFRGIFFYIFSTSQLLGVTSLISPPSQHFFGQKRPRNVREFCRWDHLTSAVEVLPWKSAQRSCRLIASRIRWKRSTAGWWWLEHDFYFPIYIYNI